MIIKRCFTFNNVPKKVESEMDSSQEPAGSLVVFNMSKINFTININQKSLCLKTNQISSKKNILNPKIFIILLRYVKKYFIQFEDDLHRE